MVSLQPLVSEIKEKLWNAVFVRAAAEFCEKEERQASVAAEKICLFRLSICIAAKSRA